MLALQKEQSGNLSPMDLNVAKAERIEQGQASISRRSSMQPGPCMRASMARRNRSSSRLGACSCLSVGNLRRRSGASAFTARNSSPQWEKREDAIHCPNFGPT